MSEKRSVNLCSIYMLPLLGLNQFSFGGKFINSYVSKDNQHIVVECSNPLTNQFLTNQNFRFALEKEGKYLAVFSVPPIYQEDITKFREGKYSQFSDSAKNVIRKKSGLPWKVPSSNGKVSSAKELLALDKDKVLKQYWEKVLEVELDNEAELISVPDERNFIDLKLSTQLSKI